MKSMLRYTLFGFLLLIFGSCSQEEPVVTEEPDKVLLSVPFTRAGTLVDENRVFTARLIVVRSAGQTNGGQVLVNSTTPFSVDLVNEAWQTFREMVQVGFIDLYVFANELSSWNLNAITVGSTFNFNTLRAKTFDVTDYPVVDATHGIPAFAYHQRMHVDVNGVLTYNGSTVSLIEVERIFAKVHIKINCDFADLPDNTPIRLDSVYIRTMPIRSWLIPSFYTLTGSTNFLDGTYYSPTNAFTPPFDDANGFYHEYVFYIPEYLITDITKYTYITITAHKEASPFQRFHYKLIVGDGIVSHTYQQMFETTNTADLRVSRNVWYTLNIVKITGFGDYDVNTIVLEASVSNWQFLPPIPVEG